MAVSPSTPTVKLSSRSQVTLIGDCPTSPRTNNFREAEDTVDQTDSKPNRLWAQFLCVAPILVGMFLSAMDNTIVVSSFGAIGTYFNELEKTSWIATAYLLTVSSFQPLYGKLSDIFGRKSCILFAYTLFAIGCTLCGTARNMNMLIACRALAGIGGGGLQVLSYPISFRFVPVAHGKGGQHTTAMPRASYIDQIQTGLMNIVWSCGNTAGASLGGYLADTIGWRWGFFIQLPLAIISGISVYFFLHMPVPPTSSPSISTTTLTGNAPSANEKPTPNQIALFRAKLRRIDFAGAVTLVCAVFCLLFGLDHGANVGWQNPYTITPLLFFVVLLILFGFIEDRVASEPFAPPRIVFSKSLIASYLVNFLSVAASYGQLFHVSLYFQAVLGKTASITGAWLVIVIAADLTSSLITGVIMQSTGRYYWLSTSSYIVMFGGTVTVAGGTGLLRMPKSMGEIIAGLAVTALGYGGGITTSLVSLIANADRSDQAVATAVTYFFRSLGSVVGLSIGNTLLQTTLRSTLRHAVEGKDTDEITHRVRQSLSYLNELDVETRAIVRAAYGTAIESTQILSMSLTFTAIIVSLFIVEKRLVH